MISVPVAAYEKHVYDVRKSRAMSVASKDAFDEGSMEDMIMDSLHTGDVILFKRTWHTYHAPQAALIWLYRAISGSVYDHAAVVVEDKMGIPFLLETSFSGVKLRPFETRVLQSEAKEIVLVRLKPRPDLSNEQRTTMFALATDYSANHASTREGQGLWEGTCNYFMQCQPVPTPSWIVSSTGGGEYTCPSSSIVLDFLRLMRTEAPAPQRESGISEHDKVGADVGGVICDYFTIPSRTSALSASMSLGYDFCEPVFITTSR
jgi:hypothetical protein